MAKTVEAQKPYIIEVDPREILAQNAEDDANVREDLGDLEELAASVADEEVGMVEFPVITPREDGTWRLVAGFRRLTACVEAGLDTTYCVVRPEWTDKPMSVLLAMLKENTQRKALTVKEEADAYAQLMLFPDMTVEKIAKQMGRKADYVRGQLAVAKLEHDRAVELANQGRLTLEDAAELEQFADQPKIYKRIIKKIDEHTNTGRWGGAHIINTEKSKKQYKITAAQRIQELRQAGAVILPKKPKDFGHASREADVETLRDANGGTLDGNTLVFQPGFAALLDSNQGFPKVVVVCLNPEAHGYTRHAYYDRFVSDEVRAEREREEQAAQAHRAAFAAETEVRVKFLTETYSNVKKPAAKAMLARATRLAAADPGRLYAGKAELVAALAGIDPDTIDETTSAERVNRVILARYVAYREAQFIQAASWGRKHELAAAWPLLLTSDGYAMGETETAVQVALTGALAAEVEPRTNPEDASRPCQHCGAGIEEWCEEECELWSAEDDASAEHAGGNEPAEEPEAQPAEDDHDGTDPAATEPDSQE